MTKNYKIHSVVKEISRGLNHNSYDELTSNLASIFNNYTPKLYDQIKASKKKIKNRIEGLPNVAQKP